MTAPLPLAPETLQAVLPECLLLLFALLSLLLEMALPRHRLLQPWLGVIGCLLALVVLWSVPETPDSNPLFLVDSYARFFQSLSLLGIMAVMVLTADQNHNGARPPGEWYSLLLFSAMGMLLVVSAGDFLPIVLGLEIMTLPLCVILAIQSRNDQAGQGGMTFFWVNGFGSAVLLFGVSFLYGLAGATDLPRIAQITVTASGQVSPLLVLALGLVVVGLCSKGIVVPFHFWLPKVSFHLPLPTLALVTVCLRITGLAVLGRMLFSGFPELHPYWSAILTVMSILILGLGTLEACAQPAGSQGFLFSTITHGGYALVGLLAGNEEGLAATMLYLGGMLCLEIGLYTLFLVVEAPNQRSPDERPYYGLAASHPLVAALLSFFFFTSVGMPPTLGFVGKFLVCKAALTAGHPIPAVAALFFSFLSARMYLRMIVHMYRHKATSPVQVRWSLSRAMIVTLCVVGLVGFGLFPGALVDWLQSLSLP